jgi:NAD(P)-dependent dehydrogenase (short-subunit alcohol dehydrogenase family)
MTITQGKLTDRAVLITGGGEGIGRGMARRMAREGASIVIADIQGELGERTAQTIRDEFGAQCIAVATDVCERDQVLHAVERTVDAFGAIDVLVNNAWGGTKIMRLEDKTDEILDRGLKMALWPTF